MLKLFIITIGPHMTLVIAWKTTTDWRWSPWSSGLYTYVLLLIRFYVFFSKSKKRDFFTFFCRVSYVFSNNGKGHYAWYNAWDRENKEAMAWRIPSGQVKAWWTWSAYSQRQREISSFHSWSRPRSSAEYGWLQCSHYQPSLTVFADSSIKPNN